MDNSEYIVISGEIVNRVWLPKEPPKTVILNSNGGQNNAATPVYDWIRLHELNTLAEGTCMSFAFILFTAGKERVSYPSTVFMMHGSDSNQKGRNKRKSMRKFREIFYEPWLDRMVSISNKPRKFWEKTLKHPEKHFYWSAQELKEMGVVTRIIGE